MRGAASFGRRQQPVYGQRRQVLFAGQRQDLADWLEPMPSEAGLRLAARIRDLRQVVAVVDAMRRCTPGSQTTAAYAMQAAPPWALSFGYGVIDAEDISPALRRMRGALLDSR